MHVAQVNYAWDPSLTDPDALLERYTTLSGFSRALVAAGARVSVVQRFGRNVEVVRDGVAYAFRRRNRINGTTARIGSDLVHVHGLVFPLQTWRLCRALPSRAPLVVQDHATGDPPSGDGSFFPMVRRSVRRRALSGVAAFLFTASEQAEPWRRARLIGPHQPVYELMEAAPEIARIDRADARRVSGITGSPALLWVGRLNANKDPLTVIAGFERALARLSDATLTMVYHEADLLADVTGRIRDSPALVDRIRLVGVVPHDRLAAYYSAADLFVLGSDHEGSGYALLEACACGAVPVVTDIPSFRVITDRGRLGALWPPGDAGAFARALVDMASSDLTTRSVRVLAHVEQAFSWPAIAAAAVGVYRDVVARHDRTRAPSR